MTKNKNGKNSRFEMSISLHHPFSCIYLSMYKCRRATYCVSANVALGYLKCSEWGTGSGGGGSIASILPFIHCQFDVKRVCLIKNTNAINAKIQCHSQCIHTHCELWCSIRRHWWSHRLVRFLPIFSVTKHNISYH